MSWLMLSVVLAVLLATTVQADHPACLPAAYGRGVGHPMTSCDPGWGRSGALCYKDCGEDYAGKGPVCWKHCQPGYKNIGAICCRSLFHCYAKKSHGRGAGKVPHCAAGQQTDAGLCYTHCRADYLQAGPVCIPKSGSLHCGGAFNTSCGAFCSTSTEGCAATAARLGYDVWQINQAVLRAEKDCSLAVFNKDPMEITACIFDVVGAALEVRDIAELFGRC